MKKKTNFGEKRVEIDTKKKLNVFILAMFNVSIMASLRNLPLVAEFGYQAIAYFTLAVVLFLIPCALVSAELATGWPKSGGIYIWVRAAFGDAAGFFAIWMQWAHNVAWFPAILSFVAATGFTVFAPDLAQNKIAILITVLTVYWGMTLINLLGIKISSIVSTIGAIIGTILPGLFIITLGVIWWLDPAVPDQITPSWDAFIPKFDNLNQLIFLGGLFLAFAGVEVSAGYAGEVHEPQKNYPRAIILGTLITFCIFMFGSLAIAVVIPADKISLVTGVIDALQVFLKSYHLGWLLPLTGTLLVIGAVAEINSWLIGPIKGLYASRTHGNLPPILCYRNKRNVPVNLLLLQAVLVTLASIGFLFMDNLSNTYWLMSALSTQMYLSMYILMFAAAIRLRYSHPSVPRAYRIPHPKAGMWLVASIGIIAAIFAFAIFYIPPPQFHITNIAFFESYLLVGFSVLAIIPLIIHANKKPEWEVPVHSKDL